MERDEKGRFAKGNKGGPGRKKRSTEDKYLRALHSAVTIKNWKDICKKAIVQATKGDKTARQWLSDYLLGKPVQSLSVEGQTDLTIMLAWDDAETEPDSSEAP